MVVFGELGRERTVCKVTGAAERTSVEIAIERQVAPQLAGVADGDDVVFGQLILDAEVVVVGHRRLEVFDDGENVEGRGTVGAGAENGTSAQADVVARSGGRIVAGTSFRIGGEITGESDGEVGGGPEVRLSERPGASGAGERIRSRYGGEIWQVIRERVTASGLCQLASTEDVPGKASPGAPIVLVEIVEAADSLGQAQRGR